MYKKFTLALSHTRCRYTLTDLPVRCWPVMQLSLVTQQGRSHQRLLPLHVRRTSYYPLIMLLWYVVIYLIALLLLLSKISVLHHILYTYAASQLPILLTKHQLCCIYLIALLFKDSSAPLSLIHLRCFTTTHPISSIN